MAIRRRARYKNCVVDRRTLFGTDGIRGTANVAPMTSETALRVGMAVAAHFGKNGQVVVGKDTRLSGYMLETALASGLSAMGADVMLVGPLPTPGIAYVTQSMRADAGVVISASHNSYEDNGIKLFAADGFKLPDDVEAELERLMSSDELERSRAVGRDIGKARRIDDAAGRYITHLKHAFPTGESLDDLRIVVDCAHGAAYRIAPAVFAELGAHVVEMATDPDGTNINDGCGAMYPEAMAAKVRETGADMGLALDGDADRVVISDENGHLIDGDTILAMCARDMEQRGELRGGGVVATVMSNLGLDRSLAEVGLALHRTPVGDRYVVEAMRSGGFNLGGEQSGHLLFLDHATTGDGIIAALQVLTIMRRTGTPLSQLSAVVHPFPQISASYAVAHKAPLDDLPALQRVMRDVERELGVDGRVLVRYSGTENKLRVMVEGPDAIRVREFVDRIGDAALRVLGGAP